MIRDKCRLLHRDISIGNVMIQGSGKDCGGVLLDWDYALALKPGEDESRSTGRTVSSPNDYGFPLRLRLM